MSNLEDQQYLLNEEYKSDPDLRHASSSSSILAQVG